MNKILLNGVWDIESQNKMFVLKGDVPGTDFGNLIKQGLIQNPLISGIEKDALTIAENDFVFSREFEVDKDTFTGAPTLLTLALGLLPLFLNSSNIRMRSSSSDK